MLYWSWRCIFPRFVIFGCLSLRFCFFSKHLTPCRALCSVSYEILPLDGFFRGYICCFQGAYKRLMYDVMISSPDMFGGTKKFHVWWDCDFQVERLLCSWWTCEWAKPSAGGLFHRSGWSFSTWIERCPIAVPHLLEGYKKARKDKEGLDADA